jgi:hypothetical protein
MSGYNQNYNVIQQPAVTNTATAHSGPYVIREAMQGALVIISGLGAETMALEVSPDGVLFGAPTGQTAVSNGTFYLDLRGAIAYRFTKSAALSSTVVTHSIFRYS